MSDEAPNGCPGCNPEGSATMLAMLTDRGMTAGEAKRMLSELTLARAVVEAARSYYEMHSKAYSKLADILEDATWTNETRLRQRALFDTLDRHTKASAPRTGFAQAIGAVADSLPMSDVEIPMPEQRVTPMKASAQPAEPSGTAEGATKWGIYDRNRRIWWPRAFFSQEEAQAHYDRCHQLGDDGYPRPLPAGPHPPPMARAIAEGAERMTGGAYFCPKQKPEEPSFFDLVPTVQAKARANWDAYQETLEKLRAAEQEIKLGRNGATQALEQLSEARKERDELREKIASLESRLRETTEKLRGAETERDDYLARWRAAEQRADEAEHDVDECGSERDQAVARVGELESRLKCARHEVDCAIHEASRPKDGSALLTTLGFAKKYLDEILP